MSFLSQASPQKSFNAPSTVAARIELVPSPDPAGMAESSVTSNPEPNSLSWASSEEYDREQNRGRNPGERYGGFRDGERGTDRRELLQLFPGANPFCIAEVDRAENDVEFPAWFDINPGSGGCPFSSMAMLTTWPPSRKHCGGVSVHPPARSIRTGQRLQTIWSGWIVSRGSRFRPGRRADDGFH